MPIFADIEYEYYCLDPEDIERKITDRTRVIIIVDISGQPYDVDRINDVARKHGLYIIEDNAQGPKAIYKDRYAGTLGDIDIFSLKKIGHGSMDSHVFLIMSRSFFNILAQANQSTPGVLSLLQ